MKTDKRDDGYIDTGKEINGIKILKGSGGYEFLEHPKSKPFTGMETAKEICEIRKANEEAFEQYNKAKEIFNDELELRKIKKAAAEGSYITGVCLYTKWFPEGFQNLYHSEPSLMERLEKFIPKLEQDGFTVKKVKKSYITDYVKKMEKVNSFLIKERVIEGALVPVKQELDVYEVTVCCGEL